MDSATVDFQKRKGGDELILKTSLRNKQNIISVLLRHRLEQSYEIVVHMHTSVQYARSYIIIACIVTA